MRYPRRRSCRGPSHSATPACKRSLTSISEHPAGVTITLRHTSRGAYDTARTVSNRQLDALHALAVASGTDLVWFTTPAQKQAFSDLTVRATKAIIADDQRAADDYRWYRSNWQDLQQHKDGITIDPSGQSGLIRAVSKLIPTTQQQNNDGRLSGTRDTQLPTAAAFGALTVTDRGDRAQLLHAGRIWQRMHLSASVAGLALQPLCQICERADRESSAGLAPEFTDAMATMLSTGTHPVMTFRIGYPVSASLASPRRPAADVIHAWQNWSPSMNQTLHRCWAVALTGVVALLYLWIGVSAHGGQRLLGIAGGLLILAALAAAPRSRTAAPVLLSVGALPLAVASWWSIVTPVLALLALLIGWSAVRNLGRPSPNIA